MVMAEAEVNADASLGDVVEIQVQLGGEGGALTFGMLDETDRSEGKKRLGGIRVESGLAMVEGDVGGVSWALRGGAGEVDTVGAVLLEVEDELGGQEEWERLQDGDGLLVDLLDGSFDLVAMGIWGCVGDMSLEEAQGCSERGADSLGVGVEGFD